MVVSDATTVEPGGKMPAYEFRCPVPSTKCPVTVFVTTATIAEVEEGLEAVCPHCGQPAVRTLSTFGGKFGDTEKFHGR